MIRFFKAVFKLLQLPVARKREESASDSAVNPITDISFARGKGTIKVGILHSLSGTMAGNETGLVDVSDMVEVTTEMGCSLGSFEEEGLCNYQGFGATALHVARGGKVIRYLVDECNANVFQVCVRVSRVLGSLFIHAIQIAGAGECGKCSLNQLIITPSRSF